jgi:hypothetical protein
MQCDNNTKILGVGVNYLQKFTLKWLTEEVGHKESFRI